MMFADKLVLLMLFPSIYGFQDDEGTSCSADTHSDMKNRYSESPDETDQFTSPWQVCVNYLGGDSAISQNCFCGGVLISPQWVLSSAHCFRSNDVSQPRRKSQFQFVLGVSSGRKEIFKASNILLHEGYRLNQKCVPNVNDIALIKLDHSATVDDRYIKVLQLPNANEQFDGMFCLVGDWDGKTGTNLTEDVVSISSSVCKYSSGSASSGAHAKLQGDSGGAVVCGYDTELVAGIVQFSTGCGTSGAFVPVTGYLDWIKKITGINPSVSKIRYKRAPGGSGSASSSECFEKEKTDDIYVIEHDPYYVTFDWYSPRPHMIIIGTTTDSELSFMKSMRPSGDEMTQNQKANMIEIAKMVYDQLTDYSNTYNIPLQNVPSIDSPAVFSVHFGSWFGQRCKHFHAHVTIAMDHYESWFQHYWQYKPTRKIMQKKIPRKYKNYLQTASLSPKNDYTDDEMKSFVSNLENSRLDGPDWTKYAFHEKHTRIGFISTPPKDMLVLLMDMDAFVMEHKLHTEGGHICIDISANGFTGFKRLSDGGAVDKLHVQGYLQLPAETFIMFLNVRQRSEWLSNDRDDIRIGKVYT